MLVKYKEKFEAWATREGAKKFINTLKEAEQIDQEIGFDKHLDGVTTQDVSLWAEGDCRNGALSTWPMIEKLVKALDHYEIKRIETQKFLEYDDEMARQFDMDFKACDTLKQFREDLEK